MKYPHNYVHVYDFRFESTSGLGLPLFAVICPYVSSSAITMLLFLNSPTIVLPSISVCLITAAFS